MATEKHKRQAETSKRQINLPSQAQTTQRGLGMDVFGMVRQIIAADRATRKGCRFLRCVLCAEAACPSEECDFH